MRGIMDNNCPSCGFPLDVGVTLHNYKKNYMDRLTFPYMEIGQSMHLECYLQFVIDTIIEKKMRDHGHNH